MFLSAKYIKMNVPPPLQRPLCAYQMITDEQSFKGNVDVKFLKDVLLWKNGFHLRNQWETLPYSLVQICMFSHDPKKACR